MVNRILSVIALVTSAEIDQLASNSRTFTVSTRSVERCKICWWHFVHALDKVGRLRGVSYERKVDGKREIGLLAEDVKEVVPELVAVNPDTSEVEGWARF